MNASRPSDRVVAVFTPGLGGAEKETQAHIIWELVPVLPVMDVLCDLRKVSYCLWVHFPVCPGRRRNRIFWVPSNLDMTA